MASSDSEPDWLVNQASRSQARIDKTREAHSKAVKYGQMQIRIANEIRKIKSRTSHTMTVPEVINLLETVRDPEGLG